MLRGTAQRNILSRAAVGTLGVEYMKRRLIDFDVYRKIHDESLSSAEAELVQAEDVLAKALGLDGLALHCYSESDVTYSTPDQTLIHANYDLSRQFLTL